MRKELMYMPPNELRRMVGQELLRAISYMLRAGRMALEAFETQDVANATLNKTVSDLLDQAIQHTQAATCALMRASKAWEAFLEVSNRRKKGGKHG